MSGAVCCRVTAREGERQQIVGARLLQHCTGPSHCRSQARLCSESRMCTAAQCWMHTPPQQEQQQEQQLMRAETALSRRLGCRSSLLQQARQQQVLSCGSFCFWTVTQACGSWAASRAQRQHASPAPQCCEQPATNGKFLTSFKHSRRFPLCLKLDISMPKGSSWTNESKSLLLLWSGCCVLQTTPQRSPNLLGGSVVTRCCLFM